MVKFSKRLPKDLDPSPFFAELEKAKAKALVMPTSAETASDKTAPDFIDMTVGSPLKVGLPFDLGPAVDAARGEFGTWVPDAAGRMSAREAVAEYYKARGGWFSPEQILLTASTSEAYSILFKTFCDPGDVILTPMPGYPLLDTLAQLEHLECYPYFLKLAREKEFRFMLDTDSLLSASEKAKILLLVSPHNPTGHCVGEREWNEVVHFCEERNLILVVDEVFGDYGFSDKVRRSWEYLKAGARSLSPKEGPRCPIFWLNGLSKTVGSPQLKLGWMAFYAPAEQFEPIRAALEFVADAYLSVSAPAQALAVPMLANAAMYEASIRERLRVNWKVLRSAFPSKYCPEVLGGWYAAIRLGEDDEKLTLQLLREKHVLVQPGFFFDFEEDGWVVVSLLNPPEVFAEGVARLQSMYISSKK
ncbi:MAG: pyridoxal phosphate-dependent aminotransferase [Fibrobacter sp.]|nr:pyridoxal phosphate-dependent aminotransferase [Fibrobacter sp.]